MLLSTLKDAELIDIQDSWTEFIHECLEHSILEYYKIEYFEDICNSLYDYAYNEGVSQGWCEEDDYMELQNMVYNHVVYTLELLNIPLRECVNKTEVNKEKTSTILEYLQKFPKQIQRSAEWYATRHNLLSASNMHKILGSDSQFNSIIYEKCKDLDITNIEKYDKLSPTPLNWGIRYEPVSTMIYNDMNNVIINDNFGCIVHNNLPIGASPDGIIDDPTSDKYGFLVEIKNIVNREITGIPKIEYWIQMQIQMEVCNLKYCEFLETRIKEYSYQEFHDDYTSKYKGIILFFIPKISNEFETKFIYMPLNTTNENQWIDNEKQKLCDTHIMYTTFYWYLDELSCVLIERNELWFNSFIPKIKECWKTILNERNDGFEHRAPKKRQNNIISISKNETNFKIIKTDEDGNQL